MFKMLDVALGTTTKTRGYDLAQSLAEKQAELVQANTYSDVRDYYPNTPSKFGGISGCGSPSGTMNSADGLGLTVSDCRDTSDSLSPYNNFTFSVNKKYVTLDGSELKATSSDAGLLQVTIQVKRDDGSLRFKTSGVIAK